MPWKRLLTTEGNKNVTDFPFPNPQLQFSTHAWQHFSQVFESKPIKSWVSRKNVSWVISDLGMIDEGCFPNSNIILGSLWQEITNLGPNWISNGLRFQTFARLWVSSCLTKDFLCRSLFILPALGVACYVRICPVSQEICSTPNFTTHQLCISLCSLRRLDPHRHTTDTSPSGSKREMSIRRSKSFRKWNAL